MSWLSRLPFGARCRIPDDLASVTTRREGVEVDPRAVGVDPDARDGIWEAVESFYASGIQPAISICVRRKGQVLLDRAIGHRYGNAPADAPSAPRALVAPDTPFSILSASKPVTAMLLHHLDQEDRLRLDDPVCEYVPEFGTRGKHRITIQHMLTHRAGVPNPPPEAMDPDMLRDPGGIVAVLCDQAPLWRPGTRIGYHAVTSGFLLGEVVRRVTGDDIRTYLHRTLRDPLGMRWLSYGVAPDDMREVAVNAFTGLGLFPPVAQLMQRALAIDFHEAVKLTNDARFLTSIFPSANVVTTADELCRFYELLRRGGELDGVRVFERRTVVRSVAEQSYLEPDMTLVLPFRYGSGFMLGAEWFSLYGPFTRHAFGHLGLTNVVGWADPDRDVSGAILTSGKPVVTPEVVYLFEILRRIGAACPPDGSGVVGSPPGA